MANIARGLEGGGPTKGGVRRRDNQVIRIEGDRKDRTGDRKGVIDKSLPDILTTGQSIRILRLNQLS